MKKYLEDACGTRGNGRNAVKELESRYLKITNEKMRSTQEAIATTSVTLGQDPDNYINELTRLRNVLTETEEPSTNSAFRRHRSPRYFSEGYRDVKLMSWKDPDFDLA